RPDGPRPSAQARRRGQRRRRRVDVGALQGGAPGPRSGPGRAGAGYPRLGRRPRGAHLVGARCGGPVVPPDAPPRRRVVLPGLGLDLRPGRGAVPNPPAPPPFRDEAVRAEFARRLEEIPGVSIAANALQRRPTFLLAALVPAEGGAAMMPALDWF